MGLPSGAVLAVPLETLVQIQALSQPATTGRPMGRRTICPASSGLGEGLAGRDVLVPSPTSDSCGRTGTMHADTVARCMAFHRRIGAAGFRVKRALCQEAVRLGWVVFRRTHGFRPSPTQSPYRSYSDGTRLTTNLIPRQRGVKGFQKCCYTVK
jgi:hypothetical protein